MLTMPLWKLTGQSFKLQLFKCFNLYSICNHCTKIFIEAMLKPNEYLPISTTKLSDQFSLFRGLVKDINCRLANIG